MGIMMSRRRQKQTIQKRAAVASAPPVIPPSEPVELDLEQDDDEEELEPVQDEAPRPAMEFSAEKPSRKKKG